MGESAQRAWDRVTHSYGTPSAPEPWTKKGGRLAVSIRAVAVAAAASIACRQDKPMSWSIGRVLGDSPTALFPDVARPPLPTETTEGDNRRSDLTEGVAGNRPKTRDRWSMDVGTRATGRRGYRRPEQITEEPNETQDGAQTEGPSRPRRGRGQRQLPGRRRHQREEREQLTRRSARHRARARCVRGGSGPQRRNERRRRRRWRLTDGSRGGGPA